jgi:hypothetical protein
MREKERENWNAPCANVERSHCQVEEKIVPKSEDICMHICRVEYTGASWSNSLRRDGKKWVGVGVGGRGMYIFITFGLLTI